jgi:tRNA(Ile)-lysidine synthase
MGPHPAVAAVRLCVRRSIAGLPARSLVLVACSGGADSLALADALAFEAPGLGLRAGGVTVDHGLQPGSAAQAALVVTTLTGLGLDPVRCQKVAVAARPAGRRPAGRATPEASGDRGEPRTAGPGEGRRERTAASAGGYPGPEGAARSARYAALDAVAGELGATAVLLGHTMDDQAETVLLGLARGSGARSLAGMSPASGRYLRPLLGLRREQTEAACAAAGHEPWEDPHNGCRRFARVRVRQTILPVMEELLGPGIARALARTADQLRADADALDDMAAERAAALLSPLTRAAGPQDAAAPLDTGELAVLPTAIRTRLLRMAAIAAGAPAGALTAGHVADLDALVTNWRGQRWADLPGGLRCQRRNDRLHFVAQR